MEILYCLALGYFPGTISPSALIAKIKRVDIRTSGTGNLGATNAMLSFGKTAGLLVMIFDISKAYLAFLLAEQLFPRLDFAGPLAGAAAVAGHIFPFYLGFRGGKGMACLCGMVLAFDPGLFITLLGTGLAVMIITDVSISLQLTATVLFPLLAFIRTGSLSVLLICAGVCILVLVKHRSNIAAAVRGEDVRVREFVREHFPAHHTDSIS